MATLIVQGVNFVVNPTQDQIVTMKYRLTSDPDVPASYTILGTNIVVSIDGTITPNITLTPLLDNTSYTIITTNNCSGRSNTRAIITNNPITYVWIEDVYVCEKDTLINSVLVATGFSSPNKLFYDETSGRVYCVDSDSTVGNIFWFNPNTFTGFGSIVYSAAITGHKIYDNTIAFDRTRRKIYVAGEDTKGVIVYDIATDTAITPAMNSQLAYGSNTAIAFDRLLLTQIGDFIYGSARAAGTLAIINANTLIRVSNNPIGTISSGSISLTDSYGIYAVNGMRWVPPAAGRVNKDIYVYNSTFTSAPIIINLPSTSVTAGWGGSKYWGTGFFDSAKNKFYYHDIGSGKTYIIDGTTRAIIKTFNFANKETKAFAQIDFSFDQNAGILYFNYTAYDTPAESAGIQKRRTYIFNRDTLEIESLYPNLITSGLTPQTGSPLLWSANRGLAVWDGGGTWNTDGIITKLTY